MSKMIEIPASESNSEVAEINDEKESKHCEQLLRISCKTTCNGIFVFIGCVILAITIISFTLMLIQYATDKQFEVAVSKTENSNRHFERSDNSKSFTQSKGFD